MNSTHQQSSDCSNKSDKEADFFQFRTAPCIKDSKQAMRSRQWSFGSSEAKDPRTEFLKNSNFFSENSDFVKPPAEKKPDPQPEPGIPDKPRSRFSSNSFSFQSEGSNLETPILALAEETLGIREEFPMVTAEALERVLTQFLDKDGFLCNPDASVLGRSLFEDEDDLPIPNYGALERVEQGSMQACNQLAKMYASGGGMQNELEDGRTRSLSNFNSEGANKKQNTKIGCPLNLEQLQRGVLDGVRYRPLIIDCRYHYEYLGGHIPTAINISSPLAINFLFNELKNLMFEDRFLQAISSLEGTEVTLDHLQKLASKFKDLTGLKTPDLHNLGGDTNGSRNTVPVLIFHCEFSSKRAPNMYRLVRTIDRTLNEYPILSFGQQFILRGGYEAWSKLDNKRSYIPMHHASYQLTLEQQETRLASEWKFLKTASKHKKLA